MMMRAYPKFSFCERETEQCFPRATGRPSNLQCVSCARAHKIHNVCLTCNRLCCKHRCGEKLNRNPETPGATGATCAECLTKKQRSPL
jgi:hypothetical protein